MKYYYNIGFVITENCFEMLKKDPYYLTHIKNLLNLAQINLFDAENKERLFIWKNFNEFVSEIAYTCLLSFLENMNLNDFLLIIVGEEISDISEYGKFISNHFKFQLKRTFTYNMEHLL